MLQSSNFQGPFFKVKERADAENPMKISGGFFHIFPAINGHVEDFPAMFDDTGIPSGYVKIAIENGHRNR